MDDFPIQPSRLLVTAVVLLSAVLVAPAQGAIFVGGDFLVVDHAANAVQEYNLAGVQLSSRPISYAGPGARPPNRVGDATVDADGNLHVYNGIFQPVLATVDATTEIQTDRPGVGFSSVNRTNVGNIAAIGNNVFVNDNNTSGSTDHGIVAFDRSNGYASQRFATDFNPNDLAAGLDGRLYALGVVNNLASASPDTIRVYDPTSFSLLNTIDLPTMTVGESLTGIAVDQVGGIFAVSNDGNLLSLDGSGNIIGSLELVQAGAIFDLDIRNDGALLAAGTGAVFVSDVSLAAFTPIDVTATGPTHVAFLNVTAVPEPGVTFPLLAAASFCFVRWRRRGAAE